MDIREIALPDTEGARCEAADDGWLCTEAGEHSLHIARTENDRVCAVWSDDDVLTVGHTTIATGSTLSNGPVVGFSRPTEHGFEPMTPDEARRLALALLVMADKATEARS